MVDKHIKEKKELGIGLLFLLLLIITFIIWILTGGPNNKIKQKTLFKKTDFPAGNTSLDNTSKTGFGNTSQSGYGITPPTTKK